MTKNGEHAVVLGASMAGLLAARVLTETYARVTIVERDELPRDWASRRGATGPPCARHPPTRRRDPGGALPRCDRTDGRRRRVSTDMVVADVVVPRQADAPAIQTDVVRTG